MTEVNGLRVKRVGGRVVSAPDFRIRGHGFESPLRWNLACDHMVLHATEPLIITLPSSQ